MRLEGAASVKVCRSSNRSLEKISQGFLLAVNWSTEAPFLFQGGIGGASEKINPTGLNLDSYHPDGVYVYFLV
jgi:hypothetical protein